MPDYPLLLPALSCGKQSHHSGELCSRCAAGEVVFGTTRGSNTSRWLPGEASTSHARWRITAPDEWNCYELLNTHACGVTVARPADIIDLASAVRTSRGGFFAWRQLPD